MTLRQSGQFLEAGRDCASQVLMHSRSKKWSQGLICARLLRGSWQIPQRAPASLDDCLPRNAAYSTSRINVRPLSGVASVSASSGSDGSGRVRGGSVPTASSMMACKLFCSGVDSFCSPSIVAFASSGMFKFCGVCFLWYLPWKKE